METENPENFDDGMTKAAPEGMFKAKTGGKNPLAELKEKYKRNRVLKDVKTFEEAGFDLAVQAFEEMIDDVLFFPMDIEMLKQKLEDVKK